MVNVRESAGKAASPLNAALEAGNEALTRGYTVTFQRYVQLVLPLDGFVFWVNADLVKTSNLADMPKSAGPGPNSVEVKGSLHYAADQRQDEDQTIGLNRVLFATSEEIQTFNDISPTTIFIATVDDIRFAFSRHGNLAPEAGMFHYQGDAIYAPMESQIIDELEDFDNTHVVVSNSLPIWLTLNEIMPVYPSFLIPANIRPPFAAIHIDPNGTTALQAVPFIARDGSHYQLVSDRVRITIYGLRNNDALDYQDYLFKYMENTDNMGLMDMPVIRDAKRTQSELSILAMKKVMDVQVSYYQTRIQDIARQFIKSCIPNFIVQQL